MFPELLTSSRHSEVSRCAEKGCTGRDVIINYSIRWGGCYGQTVCVVLKIGGQTKMSDRGSNQFLMTPGTRPPCFDED